MAKRRDPVQFLQRLLLVAVVMAFLFPFFWMILASFKTQQQILSTNNIFVFEPTFQNYLDVFQQYSFMKFILNSFFIAAALNDSLIGAGFARAYSIARYRQNKLGMTILIARIVPGITFLIPWFIIFSKLGLVDSYTSMILSHMLVGLPFIVWIMVSYFENIPSELEESARVDGCTIQGAFWRIVLPISGPGIITSSIFSFVFSWNNFMFSLVLSGQKTETLPIAVFSFSVLLLNQLGGLDGWSGCDHSPCADSSPVRAEIYHQWLNGWGSKRINKELNWREPIMFKHRLWHNGILAILRGFNKQETYDTVQALIEAGVFMVEVTSDSPNAWHVINTLKAREPRLVVGAGTVLDTETAREAIEAGARFYLFASRSS